MSISPTALICPSCEGKTLDAISVPTGNWLSCPSCTGIFIHQDLVCRLSRDPKGTRNSLEETKFLLLPTERNCPQCSIQMVDGCARSLGIIVSICSTCESIWTFLPVLATLDPAIESALRSPLEEAWATSPGALPPLVTAHEDTGFGTTFRSLARLFDSLADKLGRKPKAPAWAKKLASKPAPAPKPQSQPRPQPQPQQWKPLPRETKPQPIAKPPEPFSPTMDTGGFTFPDIQEGFPLPASFEQERAPKPLEKIPPKEELKPKPVAPPPVPKVEPPPEPQWTPIVAPEIHEELFDQPVREPLTELATEPVPPAPVPPAPKPAPVVEQTPTPKPVIAPLPAKVQPISFVAEGKKRAGFFSALKEALKAKPKIKETKSVPTPKPVEPPKKTELPKPILPQKPKGPSIWDSMKAAWKPLPKKKAEPVKPKEVPPTPIEIPKPVERAEPVVVPKPIVPQKPKPIAAPKPAPLPKIKREKAPKDPFDLVAFGLPWGMAALWVFLSSFREFGFEGEPAVLWGLMGWSVGMFLRTKRMYTFKKFEETTLVSLSEKDAPTGWRGIPVLLKGVIMLARDEDPKGPVVFKEGDLSAPLNRLRALDILPRLVGLANPRQLIKGDVSLSGWYRGGIVPWLEVHELRVLPAGKVTRKSMVKTFRVVLPIILFVISFIINLSLE